MKIKKEQIITIIAIINTVIIAFVSYLTAFMFKNKIGETENIAKILILICLIGSLTTKLVRRSILTIILSILFDFILVIFLYNLTDYNSIYDFMKSLLNIKTHIVCFLYLYLIFYYVYTLKNYKNNFVGK
jgi:hypothetical protein